MSYSMGISDWPALDEVSRTIADLEGRLATARSTQNHGLVRLLEGKIAGAEILRERVISQIAAGLTSWSQSIVRGELVASETSPAPAQPVLALHTLEGDNSAGNLLDPSDLEHAKRELQARRAQVFARQAAELQAQDADAAEIEVLEQAIDAFVCQFKIDGADLVPVVFSRAG